jgi:hypothetical protein
MHMEKFVKIEWWPSTNTRHIRVLIDHPLNKILPATLIHNILKFIRNRSMLERLKDGGKTPSPNLTPAIISSGIHMSSHSLLYPLLEKMWIAGLLDKDYDWPNASWWWNRYGQNDFMLEALNYLDDGKIFYCIKEAA